MSGEQEEVKDQSLDGVVDRGDRSLAEYTVDNAWWHWNNYCKQGDACQSCKASAFSMGSIGFQILIFTRLEGGIRVRRSGRILSRIPTDNAAKFNI